jgi:hypothetical protein
MSAISDHQENVETEIEIKELNSGTVRPGIQDCDTVPAQSARIVVEKKFELF